MAGVDEGGALLPSGSTGHLEAKASLDAVALGEGHEAPASAERRASG